MPRARTKASSNPIADIAAGNLDRATTEIVGTIDALGHIQSTRSGAAADHLKQALQHIAEARELTIETFEQNS